MGSILNGIALHGGTRAVRRHVPGLQRLHAPGGAAGRADEAAGHLRLDARLDRPRRGRPDPPAGRAPRGAAGDPRASTWSARPTPTRPPSAWRHDPGAHRPAGRAVPDPAEPADLRPRPARRRPRASPGRLRAGRRVRRPAAGDPHRHRLRGAARRRGPRAAGGRGHPDPGGLDAVPGVVPRAGRGVPQQVLPAGGEGAGQRRGRRRAWAGATSSATPARCVSLEHFGASAPYQVLFEQFGFTADRVVAAAHASAVAGRRDHRARTTGN